MSKQPTATLEAFEPSDEEAKMMSTREPVTHWVPTLTTPESALTRLILAGHKYFTFQGQYFYAAKSIYHAPAEKIYMVAAYDPHHKPNRYERKFMRVAEQIKQEGFKDINLEAKNEYTELFRPLFEFMMGEDHEQG